MAIVSDVFGTVARFTGVSSINQIPFIVIGGFGLFLYMMYAGKTASDTGKRGEGLLGMFIVLAFVLDIFYLHDVWLVAISGTLSGLYSLLAFTGVVGVMKKMGRLGYAQAKEVRGKISEIRAKKQEEQQTKAALNAIATEALEEREESVLLINPDFMNTVNKVNATKSYFFNIQYAQQNVAALAHLLIYLRRIVQVLHVKEKASARLAGIESREAKLEQREAKAERKESAAERQELPAEKKEISDLIREARLIPAQMRGEVQSAVAKLEGVEAESVQIAGTEGQEAAEENVIIQFSNVQKKMALELNPLQNRMLKICRRMESSLAKIDAAEARGAIAAESAVRRYGPAQFFADYTLLKNEHEQIRNIMIKAIEEEIAEVKQKINEAMLERNAVVKEESVDQLLANAEKVEEQIDKVVSRKNEEKARTELTETFSDAGITQTEGAMDVQYLQQLQSALAHLQQMLAALAAAR